MSYLFGEPVMYCVVVPISLPHVDTVAAELSLQNSTEVWSMLQYGRAVCWTWH